MSLIYIPRRLIVGEKYFSEEQLLQEGRVIVVLAEPGAGKTELLNALAGFLRTKRLKASIFQHRPPPVPTGPLVIDGIDEVARIDAAATDRIIAQASSLSGATVVVLAGRSSEWDQGRTAYVQQCFGVEPVVVRLQPFDETEQRTLFANAFAGEDFDAFTEVVQRFELQPLMGNPQFLTLIGEAYLQSGRVFTSKAQIFSDAIKRLTHEANTELGRQNRPATDVIIECAGEVFAKLMLAGATGIATVEQLSDQDYPYLKTLSHNERAAAFLPDTRLLKPGDDPNWHEPVHRIVAEYGAASYLARRISDPSDRLTQRRVFSILAPNGVVRDELRGMLGWAAALGHEPLQLAAIQLDPYAVLANGDPSQLTTAAKTALLTALTTLAQEDPFFRRSDVWRRFNVGQFFTPGTLSQARTILATPGPLRSLILELLHETKAAASLIPELTEVLLDPAGASSTRRQAIWTLLGVPKFDAINAFDALLQEGSVQALELASMAITTAGVVPFGAGRVESLLGHLPRIYTQVRRRGGGASRHFITRLVKSFNLPDTVFFLNALAPQIICTCAPENDYLCRCRDGISKIVGRLLDRYFELSDGPHDPVQVWRWTKGLRFEGHKAPSHSVSAACLGSDAALRRAMQQLAVSESGDRGGGRKAVSNLYHSHMHSGLHIRAGDREALSQFAFDNGLVEVWESLYFAHVGFRESKDPNPARALQRQHAQQSPALLRVWASRERIQRKYNVDYRRAVHFRGRARGLAREVAVEAANRAQLQANITAVEAGQHWPFLLEFARAYLFKPDEPPKFGANPKTPVRALQNCFPMVEPYVPALDGLARREWPDISMVLLAACLVRYRNGDSLRTISPRILAAAKTEMSSYPAFVEGEADQFEAALDRALFTAPGDTERFARVYFEPQLSGATENASRYVYWLGDKSAFHSLRPTLPLEWLERFPQMPLSAASELFGIAARFGDRTAFLELVGRRVADSGTLGATSDTKAEAEAVARRRFWQLQAYLHQAPGCEDAWASLKDDPKTIFALEHQFGRFASHDGEYRPPMRAQSVYDILDAFVCVWPKVFLPDSYGSGDPEEETAYRFLLDCIWKIDEDEPRHQLSVLDQIIADARFRDMHDAARTLRAEAVRQIALEDFRVPRPAEIDLLLEARGVASVEDLRALLLEELEILQLWVKGAETDPLDAFYVADRHVDENTARNRIVERLEGRLTALGLPITIERHMAGGNRCDITAMASFSGMHRLLVIEVKGQWNTQLYTAAAAQLDARYAIHPDAARQGVYLVLWYGNGEKIAGLSNPTVSTAAELRKQIEAEMNDELRKRVDVVVLDLSRPKRSQQKTPVTPKKFEPTPPINL